jgi:AraC family transcriptional regulator, transcriptional activator of pobA
MNNSIREPHKTAPDPPVPVVDFYADTDTWPAAELVHSEPLAERSQLHDWTIRPHRHSRLTQLFLLSEGQGVATLDASRYDARAPCVLVIPEFCVHEFQWARDSAGFVLSIATTLVGDLSRETSSRGPLLEKHAVIDVSEDLDFVHSLFAQIQAECQQHRPFKEASLHSLVRLVALTLARNARTVADPATNHSRASSHFAEFRQLVEEHHKSHRSVSDYATALGITPSHLNAICQRLSGKSALESIHERLMLAARRDLVYTEKTIAGVSQHLGFSDPSYFTRFFRRHAGVSPSQYRRRSGTYDASSSSAQ